MTVSSQRYGLFGATCTPLFVCCIHVLANVLHGHHSHEPWYVQPIHFSCYRWVKLGLEAQDLHVKQCDKK